MKYDLETCDRLLNDLRNPLWNALSDPDHLEVHDKTLAAARQQAETDPEQAQVFVRRVQKRHTIWLNWCGILQKLGLPVIPLTEAGRYRPPWVQNQVRTASQRLLDPYRKRGPSHPVRREVRTANKRLLHPPGRKRGPSLAAFYLYFEGVNHNIFLAPIKTFLPYIVERRCSELFFGLLEDRPVKVPDTVGQVDHVRAF